MLTFQTLDQPLNAAVWLREEVMWLAALCPWELGAGPERQQSTVRNSASGLSPPRRGWTVETARWPGAPRGVVHWPPGSASARRSGVVQRWKYSGERL